MAFTFVYNYANAKQWLMRGGFARVNDGPADPDGVKAGRHHARNAGGSQESKPSSGQPKADRLIPQGRDASEPGALPPAASTSRCDPRAPAPPPTYRRSIPPPPSPAPPTKQRARDTSRSRRRHW